MKTYNISPRLLLVFFMTTTFFALEEASAQSQANYLRIANIVVDSTKLESFKAALREGVETAVRTEQGVLMLNAVYDIKNPTHVTVFEIYADENAYKLHIQTPHFKKYKATVENMVKSLKLTDVLPIAVEAKMKPK